VTGRAFTDQTFIEQTSQRQESFAKQLTLAKAPGNGETESTGSVIELTPHFSEVYWVGDGPDRCDRSLHFRAMKKVAPLKPRGQDPANTSLK